MNIESPASPIEILRSDIRRIIDEENKSGMSPHFDKRFDVLDLTVDDLEFYIKFKNGELTTDGVIKRKKFFERSDMNSSQDQLLSYITEQVE